MTIKWEINPYIGVGPLKFGMGYEEVANIIGSPITTQDNTDPRNNVKLISEKRSDTLFAMITTHYRKSKLQEIVFEKNKKPLLIKDYNLFSETRKKNIEFLTEFSKTVFEDFEGFIFLDHGVYLPSVESYKWDKHISIFSKGLYDSSIEDAITENEGEYIKGGPS